MAHGHLEAANIIMTAGPQPVIVDFGASSALRALQGVDTSAAAMAQEDRIAIEVLRTFLTDPA